MAKVRSQYVCQKCEYAQVGWAGKCPSCDSWGTLIETIPLRQAYAGQARKKSASSVKAVSLSSVSASSTKRVPTKISEFDQVLGGGIVPGQVILLAGEPGVGKSTLLLQVADKLARPQTPKRSDGGRGEVLYVAGEESAYQIKLRADRLKIGKKAKNISILEETDIDSAIATATSTEKLNLLVVDSIQTVHTSDLRGMAGAVGQVRESASRLVRFAKSQNVPVIIVGHVTKEGSVAGPAALAHIVDTVAWFEGDKNLALRMLRSIKNRFGPTDEIGIFTMEEKGLIPVDDSSGIFVDKERDNTPGAVVSCVLEGTRPILVEVQSLVVSSKLAFPKRVTQGVDQKRVELILAVLQKRANLPFYNFDVYVNVVGGIKLREPAADLAIALSLTSALKNKSVDNKTVAVGEVGLLGEIRSASQQEKRLKYARRQGFTKIISSKQHRYISTAVSKLIK